MNRFTVMCIRLRSLVVLILFLLAGNIYGQTSWYTLASGDWDNPEIWTKDPSGALPNNPDGYTPTTSPTAVNDRVYILSGRTITVGNNGKTNAMLTVSGGIDFRATTGHAFTEIRGSGRIILKADNFPSGNATHFISQYQGEGTVVYDSTGYDITIPRIFYHVEVDLDNPADIITFLADYQVNGNLTLTQGKLRINDNNPGSTTPINFTVAGNVNVAEEASMSVGTADAYDAGQNYYYRYHNFTVSGNFVSYGKIRFTNQAQPDYTNRSTTGAVTLHFTGASDKYFKLYDTTDLYNLHVNKGSDATYELDLYAHNKSFFALYGTNYSTYDRAVEHPQHDKAFWIEAGAVRLKGEVVIPSLAEGGNDWTIGANAALILDGENVEVYTTALTSDSWTGFSHANPPDNISDGTGSQGIYVYGDLKIENGYFSTQNASGILYRDEAAGSVTISGGEVSIAQLRLTGSATSGYYSFIQSGGIFRVRGNGEESNSYALFSLNEPEMYFAMSGGQLIIEDYTTYTYGAVEILCDDGNFNVTGGEVVCNWGANSQIYSTSDFFDMSVTGGTTASLSTALTVMNDLTIDATSRLDANGLDLSIGGDFVFEDGATYTHDNNTTYFIGSGNSTIDIRNTTTASDLVFYNLNIEKDKLTSTTFYDVALLSAGRSTTAGVAANTAITVLNNITITRGSFNSYQYTVRLNGDIEIVDGEITADGTLPGRIELTGGTAQHTLKGSIYKEQSFGHLEIDDANDVILLSNVNCTDVTFTNGMFFLDEYNLTVTGSIYGYDATHYFQTAGNGGDGGLTVTFTLTGNYGANSLVATIPVGSPTGYSRGEIFINGYNFGATSITGTVTVAPVNAKHPGAPPGGWSINYYWVSKQSGFDAVPVNEVIYMFYLPTGITKAGSHRDHALIGSEWYQTDNEGVSSVVRFNKASFGFVDGEFTSGNSGQFNNRRTLYSRQSGTWHDKNSWSLQPHGGTQNPLGNGDNLPQATDICVVGEQHRIYAWAAFSVGRIEFVHDTAGPTGFEDIPRVAVSGNYTFACGKVTGTGMFTEYLNTTVNPNVTGDFGEFANEKYSWYLYVADGNNITIPSTQTIFPNLALESSGGWRNMTFANDIYVNYNLNPRGSAILLLNTGANGDIYVGGNCYVGDWDHGKIAFPSTGTARTLTIMGDLDFTLSTTAPTADREIYVANTTPSSLTHQLIVGGDIIQDVGVIDLYNGTGTANNAVLTLSGETNGEFTKTGTPTTQFYRLVMDKLQGNSFTFTNDFSLMGLTNGATKALELSSGDLSILGGATTVTLTSGGADFDIPATASLTVENATIQASGTNTGIYLDGLMVVGDNSTWNLNGGTNNYIEYSASGNAEIQINAGTLLVGSQIRRNVITDDGILAFSQNSSSSTVRIGETNAPENRRGVFEILNTGSSFTQTAGAEITLVQAQTTPAFPALYLSPATANLGLNSGFIIGNGSTPLNDDIGVYADVNLQNLTIDGTRTPTATMWTVPLTIDGDLTIESGATFSANGLDLIVNGDFLNYGNFDHNSNTTYFSGSANQRILGNTTFFNLTKTTSNELWLAHNAADITIANDLDFQAGILRDSSNTITLQGDCNFDATHIHGLQAGDGMYFNGTFEQNLTGAGTFGKISINNASGVSVPLGNNLAVTDTLKLTSGVFWVGKNLLTLAADAVIEEDSPFSETNMIQTNASFTDNGVRKYFNSGAGFNFVYPIGSGGKYTPVDFTVDALTSASGYITVKAADEMHPSIQEDSEAPDDEIVDADNVLQYHWILRSSNISGFDALVEFTYDPADIEVTTPYDVTDYIPARLLNDGSGEWNKYDEVIGVYEFDEANEVILFDFGGVDDDEISGDYTAGVDGSAFNGAIPNQVPFYETNTTGLWINGNIWTPFVSTGPRGAMTRINLNDTVSIESNFISSYTTEVLGRVELGTTFGHRFGEVTGTGTIYTEREVIPAGVYDDFFSSAGGTIEFGGSTNYDVLGDHALVNNITFSGTGQRRLPINNITLNGDLRIDGGSSLVMDNLNNIDLNIKGDLIRVGGQFDAGTDIDNLISFTSAVNQTISGEFTNDNTINSLVVNNPNGITISSGVVDIAGTLYLTGGHITTSATDTLRIGVTSTISPSNGSTSSFVNGPLTKVMSSGDDFLFPVGKSTGGRGLIQLNSITGITGVDTDVTVEYIFGNPNTVGDVTSVGTGVNTVSQTEYWSIDVIGDGQSTVTISLDGSSDIANAVDNITTDLIIVGWNGSQWVQVGGTYMVTGSATSGTISCSADILYSGADFQYITLASSQVITLISASVVSGDVSICNGESAEMTISIIGGTAPWNIVYSNGTTTYNENNIPSSPHTFTLPPTTTTTTYTLVSGQDNLSNSINIVGDADAVITVNALPTVAFSNNSTGDQICAGDQVIFTAGTGSNYDFYLNAGLVQSGSAVTYTTSSLTDGAQVYVEVTNASGCSDVSATTTMTVNAIPTPSITGALTSCENATDVFSIAATGNTYSWSVSGGSVQSGDGTDAVTILWDALAPVGTLSDVFTITVTETEASCSGEDTHDITIYRVPQTGAQYHISNTWEE